MMKGDVSQATAPTALNQLAEALNTPGQPFCLVTAAAERQVTVGLIGSLHQLDQLNDLCKLIPSSTSNGLSKAEPKVPSSVCNGNKKEMANGDKEKDGCDKRRDDGDKKNGGRESFVFAMVPFCQIRENGFESLSDDESILAIEVQQQLSIDTDEMIKYIDEFHNASIKKIREPECIPDDDEYEKIVAMITEREIGGGEGSSFVVPRLCRAQLEDFDQNTALSIYKKLLLQESGAYWTFIFHDGRDRWFIGASPEKHLLIENERVLMHPISGTYRKSLDRETSTETVRKEFLNFLKDEKEINELFMVTDEEMKMMCRICPDGGEMFGPELREMSHLIHTEYSLLGKWTSQSCHSISSPELKKDKTTLEDEFHQMIQAFKMSMFAPTVTGSPIKNACRRLVTYETTSRGYYSSAAILLGRDASTGNPLFDSCITIRTMELFRSGLIHMRVGASLVRDSIPSEEAKETAWKLKGLLRSIEAEEDNKNFISRKGRKPFVKTYFATAELKQLLQEKLQERNARISTFWRKTHPDTKQASPTSLPLALPIRSRQRTKMSALLIDNEDGFIHMFRHMLASLNVHSVCRSFSQLASENPTTESLNSLLHSHDLIVVGPGPGDPSEESQKMKFSQGVILQMLLPEQLLGETNGCSASTSDMPSRSTFVACPKLMCVCLGHQLLGRALNLPLKRKLVPFQGVQLEATIFKSLRKKLGFYNSFYIAGQSAELKMLIANDPDWNVDLSDDGEEVLMLRHKLFGVVSCQFHPDSILTTEGLEILQQCLEFLA